MLDPLVIEGRGVDPYVRGGVDLYIRDEMLWAVAQEWHEYGMARGKSKATFRRRQPWRQSAEDIAQWIGREL